MDIKGFTIKDGMAVPNEQMIDYKRDQAFKQIGIPLEYCNASLEDFTINQDALGNELSTQDKVQKTKAYEVVKNYVAMIKEIISVKSDFTTKSMTGKNISSQNLIFRGDGGSGKTLLSVILLKAASEVTSNVAFMTWNQFYDTLSNFEDKPSVEAMQEKLISSDFAVIDGITNYAYNSNSFFQRKMENLCVQRTNSRKPMIWTSYVSGAELCNMFGPSTQAFIRNAIIVKLPNGEVKDTFKEI